MRMLFRGLGNRPYQITATALLLLQLATVALVPIAEAQQRRDQSRGGRSSQSSGSVNRGGSARSGSTQRGSTSGRSTQPQTRSNRSTAQRGGRSTGRRTSTRRRSTSTRSRSRTRSRRVSQSRRYRNRGWRNHRYWRHQRWYGGFWVGRVLIRWATFAAIANSSTTVVVYSTTYYHYNPWYRKVLYDGEEVYVLTSAPVGYEADALPEGAETVQMDGATYYWAEWSFYQAAPGGGYIVVEPPAGAEVTTIPEETVEHDEGEDTLYQFDNLYFTRTTNDGGALVYVVEPQPPEEEIDEIPSDAVSFVADGETFYYVNFNLYVEFEENGQTGYVNGEPEIGAQLDELPEGTETIEEDGVTYYQFDMVFFEEVEDENGNAFYEVVDSPDGAVVVELETR